MLSQSLPAIFALLVWWFTTGLILFLDGLPRRSFRWSLLGSGVLAVLALAGAQQLADDTSAAGAYLGFTAGIFIWGFIEISFLMGVITGPVRRACPEGSRGLPRLRLALGAILYHELAIVVAGALLLLLTWDAANRAALWTFLALWGMRQSAKLNLFLGVRNLSEEFLPEQLKYMQSYFRRAPMNLLFPFSIIALTTLGTLLVVALLKQEPGSHQAVTLTLLATLVWLGTLEHWFLVLPIPVNALWRWSLKAREWMQFRRGNPGAQKLTPVVVPARASPRNTA